MNHPEDTCEQCGKQNVVWFAPNWLWNEVVRKPNNTDPMLCPSCFIILADQLGFSTGVWKVEQVHYDEH
jgi:hypothetical protein